MVVEHFWWDTIQLIFKNVQNYVCGTAVSWDFTKLGVPSDAEKVVNRIICKLENKYNMFLNFL